jgi:hypothetical protein
MGLVPPPLIIMYNPILQHPHPWTKWFAWYPVKVNGKHAWLKTVYRRYNWAKSSLQPFGEGYDYGTIFDVLACEDPPHTAFPRGQVPPKPPPSFKGLQDG